MAGFGFTPDNPDDDENKGRPDFSEIFKQFSGMGLNLQSLMSSLSGQTNPSALSKEMIRDISKKFLTAHGEIPVGVNDLVTSQEALSIADIWINDVTSFPALPIPDTCALSRRDWIDSTLTGWEEIAKPLVEGMSQAMTTMLNENLGEGQENFEIPGLSIPGMNIPKSAIASVLGTFMSSLISTQLGQTIGQLSTTVTGSNDVALPLTTPIRPQMIPQNVALWGQGLEIDETEIRIYLALREIAAARLFNSTPWLRDYIRHAIATYGKGIRVDISAITQQAEDAISSGELDPSNPESMTLALSGGMFTPEETPAQRAALEKIETVLALIEGWIDAIVTIAAKDRLPSLVKLRETQQRMRATNSPTQQLFASLVGLEVSPRKSREASAFWSRLTEVTDIQRRDQVWDEAYLLPSADQLGDAEAFVKSRTVPDDLSGLLE